MHGIKTLNLGHHFAESSEDAQDLADEYAAQARAAIEQNFTKHRLSADQHPVTVHVTVEVTEA